eukprot:TRINITY_DN14819_c0_g1_i1.p1 TRINITY_DN14819_c0_g1~~TRINITY_DN14819_c0_g1_i1.p1  ORF type:complete len:554 (+),score=105.92 TRINITY_DN14819_c0_g1_i1:44-1705(+)
MSHNLMTKDVTQWDLNEVGLWLESLGLREHKKAFQSNAITGSELLELTDGDLHDIGMKKLGERKKILNQLSQLNQTRDPRASLNIGDESLSLDSSSSIGDSNQSDILFVKCVHEEETRLLQVSMNVTLSQLKSEVKREFGQRMSLTWKDKDGDKIALHKEAHWKNTLLAVRNNTLRLIATPKKKELIDKEEVSFLESLVDGVIIINAKGIILFYNKSVEKMFGYTRTELLEKNVKTLMPREYAEKHDSFLKNYHTTGVAHVIGKGRSIVAQRKNGETFAAYLSVSVTVKSSKRTIFTGTIQEVTKKPDPTAVVGHSQFEILDNLLDAALVIDTKGIVKYMNRETTRLLAYTPQEVIGRNVKMLMPNPFRDEHDKYVKNYLTTGNAKVIGQGRDVVAQAKDGSLIPVHLSLSDTSIGDERVFTGILRRTQEDTNSEKSGLQIEREVLDNLAVPAIVIDEKGTIHGFNVASQNLFGFSLIEVIGKNVKVLMPSPERENHDKYLQNHLTTGKTSVIGQGRQVIALHKNGTLIPVRLSVTKKVCQGKTIFTGIIQKT